MENWFGMDPHPTDTFVHWTSYKKGAVKLATKLRETHAKIVSAGLEAELKTLTEAAYEAAINDARDSESEPW